MLNFGGGKLLSPIKSGGKLLSPIKSNLRSPARRNEQVKNIQQRIHNLTNSPPRSILKNRMQHFAPDHEDEIIMVEQDSQYNFKGHVFIENEDHILNESKSPSFSFRASQLKSPQGSLGEKIIQNLEQSQTIRDRSISVKTIRKSKTERTDRIETRFAWIQYQRLNTTWQQGALRIIYYVSKFIMQLKTHATQMKEKFLTKRMLYLIGDNGSDSHEIMKLKQLKKQHYVIYFNKIKRPNYLKVRLFCQQLLYEFNQLLRFLPQIEPDSFLKIVWDIAVVIILIMNVFYMPMVLSFDFTNPYSWIFEDLPSWIFIFDMMINFDTAYYQNGVIHHNKKLIIYHYLSWDFWLDLIIVIPYILSLFNIPYIKYTALIRVVRVKDMVENVEELLSLPENVQAIWDLCKSVYFIIFAAHYCACAWHYIGEIQVSVYEQDESWLLTQKIYDTSWTTKYIYSFYFSTITTVTVGYGDITPVTLPERVFVVIVTLIICGVFGYTISNIGEIFKSLQEKQQYYKSRIKFVNQYLKKKKLNKQLALQVRKYFEYCFKIEAERDGEADVLMNQLTKNLKEKVQIDMFSKILQKSRLLRETLDDKGIERLCSYVREIKYAPESEIFRAGDIANKLIYLKQGQINLFTVSRIFQSLCADQSDRSDSNQVFLKQVKCDVFLAECEFATNQKYIYSGQADKFTSIIYFSYEDYYKVIRENQDNIEKHAMLRDNILFNENYKKFGQICEICQWTHIFTKCPFTFFQANRGKLSNDFKSNLAQQRTEYCERKDHKSSSFQTLRHVQETVLGYLINNNLVDSQLLTDHFLEQLGFILENDEIKVQTSQSEQSEESCIVVSQEIPQIYSQKLQQSPQNITLSQVQLQQQLQPKRTIQFSSDQVIDNKQIELKQVLLVKSHKKIDTQDSCATLNRSTPKNCQKIKSQEIHLKKSTKKPTIIIFKESQNLGSDESPDQKNSERRRSTVLKNQVALFNTKLSRIKKRENTIIPSILKVDLSESIKMKCITSQSKTITQPDEISQHQWENVILETQLEIDKQSEFKFYFPSLNFDQVIKKVQEHRNKLILNHKGKSKSQNVDKLLCSNPLQKVKHKVTQQL